MEIMEIMFIIFKNVKIIFTFLKTCIKYQFGDNIIESKRTICSRFRPTKDRKTANNIQDFHPTKLES